MTVRGPGPVIPAIAAGRRSHRAGRTIHIANLSQPSRVWPQPDALRPKEHFRTRFRLADGTTVIKIGERKVLFSESRQKLFELNDAAACLASRLGGGATYANLLEDLVCKGLDRAVAAPGIRDMLQAWSKEGLAVADLSFPIGGQDFGQSIAISGTKVWLRYRTPELSTRIAPAFQHLENGPSASATTYDVVNCGGFTLVSRNRQPAAIMAARNAAPALKALLTEEVLEASEAFTALHAACLLDRQRAMLLCGSPGAGKSTLTIALDAAGFAYGGDDITLMDHSGLVRGVPFPLTAKSGSWPLVQGFRPDLGRTRIHRRLDGKRVRYLPPTEPARPDWTPVRWVIRLRRKGGSSATLKPREPADALADLLGEAYSKSGGTTVENLRMLIGVVSTARCHELIYSDLNDAVRALERLCADA